MEIHVSSGEMFAFSDVSLSVSLYLPANTSVIESLALEDNIKTYRIAKHDE
jgi:hypothetical protein